MKYLLDTQTLIWLIETPSKLTKEVSTIMDQSTAIYVSIESLREIAIKHKQGDIKLKKTFSTFCKELQQLFAIKIVNTDLNHVLEFYSLIELPGHKDPFDHLIISTAIKSKFILISSDHNFPFYEKQGLQLIKN